MSDEVETIQISTDMIATIDEILQKVDLTDVTATGGSYSELPEGYYLSELEKAVIKVSKTSGSPMVELTFKTVDDGVTVIVDDSGNAKFAKAEKTQGRKMWLYYPLNKDTAIKRFVKDMLKFEGDVAGEPILTKEYFLTTEVLADALSILEGMRIYIQLSTSVNADETCSTWKNLISWERAKKLELPM